MHHAFPNRLEYDEDIDLSPIVYLWFPKADADSWHRKYQHIYFPFAYSLNFVSWRIASLRFIFGSGENLQRFLIALNYLWLFIMPWRVSVASVIISGLLVALVVTQSHQAEEIIQPDEAYCFVSDQFRTTRGIIIDNYFMAYLFGGMQYQLEHHLFPTMPRYYYPKLRPMIKAFAEKNNLDYKLATLSEIFQRNYNLIKVCSNPMNPNVAANGPTFSADKGKKEE